MIDGASLRVPVATKPPLHQHQDPTTSWLQMVECFQKRENGVGSWLMDQGKLKVL